MSLWGILQIAVDILIFAGLGIALVKSRRRQEEDPRLTYGLKVLQNKISILEDLSDKTEVRVKQLVTILDSKIKDLHQRVIDSDNQLKRIDQAMSKTMEIAQIFENRVPHEEIIERKLTNKYINAAKMAHQGASIEEIEKQIDLPRAELDFIIKVNREQLMFNESHLPTWAQSHPLQHNPEVFEPPQVNLQELERLGDEFRKACKDFEEKAQPQQPVVQPYQFRKVYQTTR